MNDENPIYRWTPDTKDWVENRKFVAVLNDDAKCLVYRCGHFLYEDHEDDNLKPKNKDRVFTLMALEGFTTDHAGNLILIFRDNDFGDETLFYERDCEFYKLHRPPLINDVKNKCEQNQI